MHASDLKKDRTYLVTSRHANIPHGAYARVYDGQVLWAIPGESGVVAVSGCTAAFRLVEPLEEIAALIYERKAAKKRGSGR